jgi:DNA-binding NtrC family response regulator
VILLVDDDPTVLASLEWVLRGARFETRAAVTPDLALAAIDTEPLELVIQDRNYSRDTSGAEGLALLAEIRRRRPHLPVILMTAWGSLELAVEGMRRGAQDFITKPWSNERVIEAVQTALSLATLPEPQAASLGRQDLAQRGETDGLIGNHPAFLKLIEIALRVAPTEASVLITGEPGTGKELIAELLHRSSPRRRQPFLKVNLGGLSTSLIEGEMFGYVRGAFTDALQRFDLDTGAALFDETAPPALPAVGSMTLEQIERAMIEKAMSHHGGNITHVADALGLTRAALYRRLKKYGHVT